MENTMIVLADDTVGGTRVVTFYSHYTDKIMALRPYRTEIVGPGEFRPSGVDHASEAEALKAHQKKVAELRQR